MTNKETNNYLHMKTYINRTVKILRRVFNFLVFAFVSILLMSCQEKSSKNYLIDKGKNKEASSTRIAEKGITKEINPNEVVFVLPSQEQLDSLQGLMDEDEYFTFIDNSTFYFNQAKEYCETIHSSIIEINSGEKVVFIAKNGQQFPFTTKDMFWDMIVFNGKTKPEQIDITNPQDEMIRVYNTEIK